MQTLTEKLRRGFKSEAEALALAYRDELGICHTKPLDMFLLAEHLAVPTLALSLLKGELSEACYQCLTRESKKQFFAVTLFIGSRSHIIFNDLVAPARQQSDLAHELAHTILGHPASELANECVHIWMDALQICRTHVLSMQPSTSAPAEGAAHEADLQHRHAATRELDKQGAE